MRLTEVTVERRPVLERLLQLYHYDFSEFAGGDVGEDGLFQSVEHLGDYWTDPDRHAFFIRAGGRMAGFALVASYTALGQAGKVNWVAEFFVMRGYRRRGVGRRAARHVFDAFPGRWEVAQVPSNLAAQAFWRKVIGEYTGGNFRESDVDNASWRGPVQSFDNSGRTSGRPLRRMRER